MKNSLVMGVIGFFLTACVTLTPEERRLKSWKSFTATERKNCATQTDAFGFKKGYSADLSYALEQALAWKGKADGKLYKEYENQLVNLLGKDSALIEQILSEIRKCVDDKVTPERFGQVTGYPMIGLNNTLIEASALRRSKSKKEICYTETVSAETDDYHCKKNCDRWDDQVPIHYRRLKLDTNQITAGYYIKDAEGYCTGSNGCSFYRPSTVAIKEQQAFVEWPFKTWSVKAVVGLNVTICKVEI